MYIENIKIGNFGKLTKCEFDLKNGVNIIEGKNESGKTTLSEFIKFVFYGLSNKQTDGELSERKKHISWKSNDVSGSLTINIDGKRYRIERSMTAHGAGYKDSITVVDLENNSVVSGIKNPGEHFFGIPEEVFVNTVYIRQADGAYFKGESIGQSVENIFYSADESVNTTKALKKLDEARVMIKHKKNTGRGMLDAYEKERDELSLRLAEARENNELIIQNESSLRNTQASIEKNKKECEEMSGLLRKAEIHHLLEKFEEKKKYRENIQNYQKGKREIISATTFNGFFPDEEYTKSLNEIKNELSYLKKNSETVEKIYEFKDVNSFNYVKEKAALRELGGRDLLRDILSSLSFKKKINVSFSIVFALLSFLLLLLGFAFGSFVGKLASFMLIGGLLSLGVCVVLLCVAFKANGKIGKVYSTFGVNNEDALFSIIDKIEEYEEKEAQQSEIFEYNRVKKEDDEKRLSECIERVVMLLEKWGIKPDNKGYDTVTKCLENAIADINEINKNLSLYDKEIEKNEAIMAVIQGQVLGFDEKELQDEYDSIDGEYVPGTSDEIKRRYDFTVLARENLSSKQTELEKSLVYLKAKTDRPIELESRLMALNDKIEELTLKYDAYVLAIDKLTFAANSLRGKIAPELSATSGRLMGALSDGKYKDIGVSDKLEMTYSFDEEGSVHTKEIDYVSSGTKDIAYVSLRLALADLFGKKGHELPVVFDEAFARLDDGRLKNMLVVAKEYAKGDGQAIILTSQTREADIMKEITDESAYNYLYI